MNELRSRKFEHILVSLKENVESKTENGFEDITLVHRALPEVDLDGVSLETEFFGKRLAAPLVIAAMTGGHKKAKQINENLARAAQELNIAMGVGSQRAGIEKEELESTYTIAREAAPDAFLIGNLGAVQLAGGYGRKEAEKAVDMIRADALAIHLNPMHELVQTEGDRNFKGCLDAIERLKNLKVPLIAKETGAGIAREEIALLEKAGISGFDVGGLGGTSFAAVEYYRENANKELAKAFREWGIPTAISTVEALESTSLPVISTGGIRRGLEVAKAVALGSTACGIALPLLKESQKSYRDIVDWLDALLLELKSAMVLSGAEDVQGLRDSALVIRGKTREWLELRGIDVKKYANRSR